MFAISEAETAAIRAAFDRGGELSGAAVELRRLFPAITEHRAGPRLCQDHCRLDAAAAADGEADAQGAAVTASALTPRRALTSFSSTRRQGSAADAEPD
jgi:hypothetical protein